MSAQRLCHREEDDEVTWHILVARESNARSKVLDYKMISVLITLAYLDFT